MIGAARHLLALINEVLDRSKIEAGKLELTPESVNLAAMIQDMIGTAQKIAENNRNRLAVGAERDLGARLRDG